MTSQCQHCGSQLEEGAVLCVQCGQATDAPAPSAPHASTSGMDISLAPATSSQQSPAPLFSAVSDSADRGLTGIGGWLILHVIGLALGPFVAMFGLVADCRLLFGRGGQIAFAKLPGLEAVVLYEAITNLVFVTALIVLNILFYNKKKAFQTYIIIFFAVRFVLLLADHLMAARFNPHSVPTSVIQSFVVCAVWIPYFLQSRRVELTFVN